MRLPTAVIGIMVLCGLTLAGPAWASGPVPRTLTGCVIGGTLYSIHRGSADPAGKKQVTVYRINVQKLNLAPYEGKKIRVRGELLPRDRFYADPSSVRVLGPCDNASRRAISQR
ncbi:hypothetical protein [Syntrophobacter fumaroxidans]|uniref:Uncharacterized protein n=2 Tax=Syntrophobacter fumaroxidans (strain DSM 10017 / MPOB) TaxID=335543 RepID=A0LMJ9_SYNFM|nr:hypothetical protein [Syntrophobacter fumaroxidans]ABK18651.1 hypothetical protein Sfum_2977 [Syntrophobacter fumaroxidans MPOB]